MARNKFGWLLISAKQPTNDIDDDDDDDDHESIVETLWTDCGGSSRHSSYIPIDQISCDLDERIVG